MSLNLRSFLFSSLHCNLASLFPVCCTSLHFPTCPFISIYFSSVPSFPLISHCGRRIGAYSSVEDTKTRSCTSSQLRHKDVELRSFTASQLQKLRSFTASARRHEDAAQLPSFSPKTRSFSPKTRSFTASQLHSFAKTRSCAASARRREDAKLRSFTASQLQPEDAKTRSCAASSLQDFKEGSWTATRESAFHSDDEELEMTEIMKTGTFRSKFRCR